MIDKNIHKEIPTPKIIKITKESHPTTWEKLEPKDNQQDSLNGNLE